MVSGPKIPPPSLRCWCHMRPTLCLRRTVALFHVTSQGLGRVKEICKWLNAATNLMVSCSMTPSEYVAAGIANTSNGNVYWVRDRVREIAVERSSTRLER